MVRALLISWAVTLVAMLAILHAGGEAEAMVCLLFVRSGQYLDARFKSINNSKSVSVKHASFSVVDLP